jgi:hypothetical protein
MIRLATGYINIHQKLEEENSIQSPLTNTNVGLIRVRKFMKLLLIVMTISDVCF